MKLNIEGKEYDWPATIISIKDIRLLGNLPLDRPVIIEYTDDNEERTLTEEELIDLRDIEFKNIRFEYSRLYRGG